MSNKYSPIEDVENDGLEIPVVGEWGLEKYRLMGQYANLFTTSMKDKWPNMVYIDLFSSSGYAKIKSTGRIVKSSATIALSLPVPFTKYIFCEQQPALLKSLDQRIQRDYSERDTTLILGDCNERISDVLASIPKYSAGSGVLCFCFVDPFALEINFNTLQQLGNQRMDFLILIATGMAAKRNEHNYRLKGNKTVDKFLNDANWRNEFGGEANLDDPSFIRFITGKLKVNFGKLGYDEAETFYPIRNRVNGKNVLLYHLAFFSKHKLGNKFWNAAKNYGNEQTKFLF